MPETGGKVQPKWPLNRALLLDRTSIIGGKCEPSSGSGKSPGLNQFAFCELGRSCLVALAKARTLRRLLPICANHSHSRLLQTFPAGDVRRFVTMRISG